MALYWHPFLAQFLRQSYGDRLIIQEEVNLGDLPLRVDLLLIRRNPQMMLPYPFNWLGEHTLVSYCSPDDRATWKDLSKLEVYGLLYQLREEFAARSDVTLWLLASRFERDVGKRGGATLTQARRDGRAVRRGSLDGFPTCLIDLSALPVGKATLPLLMVAKGKQEKPLGEFLVEHAAEMPYYLRYYAELHLSSLLEVLQMKKLTAEQIGLDPHDLVRFIKMFGEEKILRAWGEEHVVRLLGEEQVLDLLGEERVLRWLKKRQGRDGQTRRRRRAQ
ncbi:MAG: hypothetical protein NZT92_03695 [Abditibacteriales bacterium]|nr:hypothetical protein [Abditibacteriales bacterium]MDW8365228.1 hypothetical protein [Abditibacteriales bacterium]